MAVSPDSKQLAFLGAVSLNDPLAQSLFTVSLSGGTPKNLTENVKSSATWVDWLNNKTRKAVQDKVLTIFAYEFVLSRLHGHF